MSYPSLHVNMRLSDEELRRAAKAAPEGRMWIRVLAIRYLLQGHTTAQAAQAFACSESQVRQRVHRYNTEGLEGLRERPRSGRPTLLAAGRVEAFKEQLQRGLAETPGLLAVHASDIRRLLAEEFEALYSRSGTYRLLHRLGLPTSGRRPYQPEGTSEDQEALKNRLGLR
jgi:putative transposase